MDSKTLGTELQSKASAMGARTSALREKVENLTNAATEDMIGKVEEIETMASALQRDVKEIYSDHGADYETARELHQVADSKLTSLEQEVDALSTGNPTTVSAAVDAVMNIGRD